MPSTPSHGPILVGPPTSASSAACEAGPGRLPQPHRGLGVGLVALVKLVAAAAPVLVAYDRLPWPRLWRGVSWVGGLGLVLYGGVSTVVAQLVLSGALGSADGYDPVAMAGHAWLWDPLFLLWGGALCLHLLATRRPVPSSESATPHPW